ncbi:MAG: LysR family transcriptional regulator [Turicibacter sp.]|jgi:DNA-binding transcriptional LysR family regulator|uniref:LysR family transcriptional regulator n=1 Tax=Turicibacter faecis TaxID=2963365 RepID=A0ABM8IJV7_9FIRM|nr:MULTISPECIES: LysR family transcriptional regulator [unclassified Turicibacter]MCI8701181.1 LysR family transcriptional regulator [Turicibacter sp.]BEH91536.1 LysR family transcriptional regulator [Turicibacter sp. TC023]MCU7203740.1 LysR family transcriptional regulator [Turicibacter sp. TA25]MCU7209138.1 LysR family transcriptional regulator [Turicibacter sp. 1E2]NCE79350.1 LysR family transcriptional regulator [Turicibacter sp. TS3]
MNIRKLHIFYKTATCLNMSQVAKEMYISQPSISQCISELESEMGIRLFDRIGKKLYLTNEGKIFYEYTRRLLNIYEEAVDAVQYSKTHQGKIVIGASTTIGAYIMPYVIHEFNKREKDIKISMIIDNKHHIEELLLTNKVDLAFIEGSIGAKEIISKDIWTDELVFISSTEHNWREKEYLEVADLQDNVFIIRESGSGTRERFEEFLESQGITVNSTIELSHLEAILNYVKLNMGVSCVPYMSVIREERLHSLKVYRLKGHELNRSLFCAIHRDKYISVPIKCFMDFCEEFDMFNSKS